MIKVMLQLHSYIAGYLLYSSIYKKIDTNEYNYNNLQYHYYYLIHILTIFISDEVIAFCPFQLTHHYCTVFFQEVLCYLFLQFEVLPKI